jgi:NAD+ synthase (glutamine-hydrolysing)
METMKTHRRYGFCRVGVVSPSVAPAAVSSNTDALVASALRADADGVSVCVFPELCVTGYTCGDLFFQPSLLDAAERGLARFLDATRGSGTLFLLGAPLRLGDLLLNCAVACCRGAVVGVIPKVFLPNTREFYERRWFSSGRDVRAAVVRVCGADAPFGTDLLFQADGFPGCVVGVELCEDLWCPAPPSQTLAVGGATVLCNLSASNELVGKADYRRALVLQQSARCLAAYAYAGAGPGESTTDLVFGGHALVAENGRLLAEGERFARQGAYVLADVDLAFLQFERRQNMAYADCAARAAPLRRVVFGKESSCLVPRASSDDKRDTSHDIAGRLLRPVEPRPFVPDEPATRDARCAEVFAIQSTGLATRLLHAGFRSAVVGVSGGLDSALALLVACEAFDRAGLDRSGIRAMTMPGFGTTERTLGNARRLCGGLGVTLEEIDITAACRQHLADLGHGGGAHDIAFENTQARERTQLLMDRANMLGALVVGTGDLSELALGWCTFNGDHMSMYGVNGGVPKTLVRHLIKWVAEHRVDAKAAAALTDILATPVSPELLPADAEGKIAQKTEDVVGPYELHDFFLYHFVRCGAPAEKIRFLAGIAFGERYAPEEIDRWLALFFKRFFSQQFKRSSLPDGPKVGSVGLSPRGDWRMPSDLPAGLGS